MGNIIPIDELTCPQSVATPISCVMVIDASGDMASSIPASGSGHLYIARAWQAELKRMQSECAVIASNSKNVLRTDFTESRAKLDTAITLIPRSGITSYDNMFLDTVAGAFRVAEGGRYRRAILLVTDGKGTIADTDQLISEARRLSVAVYIITLGKKCPIALRRVCEETGGAWFENAIDYSALESMTRSISYLSQGIQPCVVNWAVSACESGTTKGTLSYGKARDSIRYSIGVDRIASFEIIQNTAEFNDIPTGTPSSRTVRVTAKNGPLKVISIENSNPLFTVSPTSFELEQDASIELQVSVTPQREVLQWARFKLITEDCHRGRFFAVLRYSARSPYSNGLTLLAPNGAFSVRPGNHVEVKWTGNTPTQTVSLQFSIDDGSTWEDIERGITGDVYIWTVPQIAITSCLVRVMLDDATPVTPPGLVRILDGESQDIHQARWSSDGSRILSIDNKGLLEVWNATTGDLIHSIRTNATQLYAGYWHPDGEHILVTGHNKTSDQDVVSVYEATRGVMTYTLPTFLGRVNVAAWSPNGEIIAIAGDTTALYWSADGSRIEIAIGLHSEIAWHPSSEYVLLSDGHGASLWDVVRGSVAYSTGPLAKLVQPQFIAPQGMQWRRDGRRFVVGVTSHDLLEVWDVPTNSMICSTHIGEAPPKLNWSPDASKILAYHELRVLLVDTNTCDVSFRGVSDDSFKTACWSPDSKTIATGSERVQLRDANGQVSHTYDSQGGWIRHVEFSPDGASILSSDRQGRIFIWGSGRKAVIADTSDVPLHLNEGVTTVDDETNNTPGGMVSIQVIPNPATENTVLVRYTSQGSRPGRIVIVDICGTTVWSISTETSSALTNEIAIELSDIPTGAYYIKYTSGTQSCAAQLRVVR